MDELKFYKAMTHLFESKLKTYTEKTLEVWYNELKRYPEEKVFFAIRKLIQDKDPFISVGKIISLFDNNEQDVEDVWLECLNSARCGGNSKISNRAARALNALGGMEALRDSNREDTHWFKKNFIDAYNNVGDAPLEVRCLGQNAEIYLEDSALPEEEVFFLE